MSWTKLTSFPEHKIDNHSGSFNYWKIEKGIVWHQGRKLRKADPSTFEVWYYPEIYFPFIARDESGIYYAWSSIKSADRRTFMHIGGSYWKDAIQAYCEFETSIKPLSGNDAVSFRYLGGDYAADSKFAYYAGKVIKSCENPKSFNLIDESNYCFATDGEKIFYEGSQIKGADANSWELISGGFSKDRKAIYFCSRKLPSAKVSSWELLNGNYSRDSNNLYLMSFKMKNVDLNSWEYLDHGYSRDRNHVYESSSILEGADPNSFVVIDENTAKDKNRDYSSWVD